MSIDCIDQYRISSNTDLLYTSNNSRYEYYLMYNSICDEPKYNNDCFATIKKIREKNPYVPGKYFDFTAIAKETPCTIKLEELRIPLSYFILLTNMKWHPSWAGTITIEIMPSYKNFVWAPVVHEAVLHTDKDWIALLKDDHKVDLGFNNMNSKMLNLVAQDSTSKVLSATEQTFTATTSTTKSCKIRLAQYMLKMDVFNGLAAKYIQVPLLFPIQIIEPKNFTEAIKADAQPRCATTVALKHCDSMFCVFPRDKNDRTCFKNPGIRYNFNIDGKFYPREPYQTLDDPKNINMLSDALNINNNMLHSIPDDLRTSLQPYYKKTTFSATGKKGTNSIEFCGGDESNHMIGIPFADSDDFMGGISTVNTVQIELVGERIGASKALKDVSFDAPVGIYVQDAFLKIRSMKPQGRSQIEITTATIEQIYAGAL